MAIKYAIKFLGYIDNDLDFRSQLNQCLTKAELNSCLSVNNFHFTEQEFEEGVRLLHVQCQYMEQAQDLLHKAEWVRFLFTTP